MSSDNHTPAEAPIFSALITPHRSLGGVGFIVLMAIVSLFSFAAGLAFFLMGAWPVVGFFGLDVLLIYWAFRINYRSAAAFEEVTVTASTLTVRQISPRGEVRQYTLNPLWVQIDRETHEEFGIARLFLVSHGKRWPVANFLGPAERESFAKALGAALGEAKRGPTRSPVA